MRVHKEDARYLYIRVSKWAWKVIQLRQRREYSVVKLRRGFTHLLKSESLSKNENVLKNGTLSKKENLKGKRFLIFSKKSNFDQSSFRRLSDIKYEVLNKKAWTISHQIFQKVSQMCGNWYGSSNPV